MRFQLGIGSAVRKFFPRSIRYSLAVFIIVETTMSILAYRAAEDHLRHNDPRHLQNRSEVSFYFAPLRLNKGMIFSTLELVEYLDELGYQSQTEAAPASYFLSKQSLEIRPRSLIFPHLLISFERNRITQILANGVAVNEADIEPLPMQEFIRYLKDDSLKEQRVRRLVLAPKTVPAVVSNAVTSIEDRRFFEHHGVDVLGIVSRVLQGEGGGSSITQQLIKNTVFKGARDEFWQRYLA
ncbi:MAG TPA: transglycosylase domain-containing protein, partial [Pyrinomonadaceae bacterium]